MKTLSILLLALLLVGSVSAVCYSEIARVPVTCNGKVTLDEWDGACRRIECSGKKVLICDKEHYFEMYDQGGPDEIVVCLIGECLADEGFHRSPQYPVCNKPPIIDCERNLFITEELRELEEENQHLKELLQRIHILLELLFP